MQISHDGLEKIKSYEKFVRVSYLDIGNVWTIGYGTTRYFNGTHVGPHQIITESQALIYLEKYCNDIAKQISNIINIIKVDLNQNQIDALISLVYNIGIGNFQKSTVLKQINLDPKDFDKIKPHWLAFDMADNKHIVGLLNRRKDEFLTYSTRKM